MSEHSNQHLPSPEFRTSLEREVVQAFRRQSQFSAPPSVARRARLRTAATLVIGLALGAGGVAASAQVQNARVRDSLTLSAELRLRVEVLKLELARANYELVKKAVDAGARSRLDLADAELDLARANTNIKKLDLEMQEIKATGNAPGFELWSPKVGSRDFVSERLKADASWVAAKILMFERALVDTRAKIAVGALAASDSAGPEQDVWVFRHDLEFISRQLEWREQFLAGKMDESAISAARTRYSYKSDLEAVVRRVLDATQRAKRAKDLQQIGSGTLLDVKRAELDVLESTQQIERLQKVLKLYDAAQAVKKKD